MSSMIIPIGFGSSGASGGGSFIQVYADLPTFLQGKYMKVSLNNEDLYADSIPTDVNMVNLQITEAGTYSIKLYTSSSSSSPLETHTVLVNSLTANYSVKVGESIYWSESSITYVVASDTVRKTSTKKNGTTGSGSTVLITETYTPTYSGVYRFKIYGTGSKSGGSYSATLYLFIDNSYNSTIATITSNDFTTSSTTVTGSKDVELKAGETYTITYQISNAGGTSYPVTYSNTYYTICYNTQSLPGNSKGIYSRAVKSIQGGQIPAGQGDVTITISPVDPSKSICYSTANFDGGSSSQQETIFVPTTPNYITLKKYAYGKLNWVLVTYY